MNLDETWESKLGPYFPPYDGRKMVEADFFRMSTMSFCRLVYPVEKGGNRLKVGIE
jgi:hypothetical protein